MINEAEAARAAAQSELDNLVEPEILTDAEIWAMIDSFAEIGAKLDDAQPEQMSAFYESLRLELRYKPAEQAVMVSAELRVGNERVRGRSCTLFTRFTMAR